MQPDAASRRRSPPKSVTYLSVAPKTVVEEHSAWADGFGPVSVCPILSVFWARWCFCGRITPVMMGGWSPRHLSDGPMTLEGVEPNMPEPKEHTRDRNFIEDILRRVPGFRGYLEKEYRRASDDLQRDALADRLGRAKRAIDEAGRRLVDAGQIDTLPRWIACGASSTR